MNRAAEASSPVRPAAQLPEPGRFWIRYVPRAWEIPEYPWIHLSSARLGEWGRGAARGAAPSGPAILSSLLDAPLDDVLYLPPVSPRRAAARDQLASSRLVDGTPILLQLFPGESSGVPTVSGLALVFDLLPALLGRDLARLREVPAGATAAWPLIPGLTDDPALWDEGCAVLAEAGARQVQAITPELSPVDRRRLADRWGQEEGVFEALFHREPPPERDFARAAHRHGLAPFLHRPLPRPPVLRIENRRIAGVLALVAELWLRVGRTPEQGQSFYRAARWIDGTAYDLEALVHEGNLGVLPLDPGSREIVAELVETGDVGLLAELMTEYVAEENEPCAET